MRISGVKIESNVLVNNDADPCCIPEKYEAVHTDQLISLPVYGERRSATKPK